MIQFTYEQQITCSHDHEAALREAIRKLQDAPLLDTAIWDRIDVTPYQERPRVSWKINYQYAPTITTGDTAGIVVPNTGGTPVQWVHYEDLKI